jgi:hypothetical protein
VAHFGRLGQLLECLLQRIQDAQARARLTPNAQENVDAICGFIAEDSARTSDEYRLGGSMASILKE